MLFGELAKVRGNSALQVRCILHMNTFHGILTSEADEFRPASLESTWYGTVIEF